MKAIDPARAGPTITIGLAFFATVRRHRLSRRSDDG